MTRITIDQYTVNQLIKIAVSYQLNTYDEVIQYLLRKSWEEKEE